MLLACKSTRYPGIGGFFTSTFLHLFCSLILWASVVQAQEIKKIGVILPLTGSAASYGEQYREGLEFAARSYPNIKLIFEDSKFESMQALSALKKLQNYDKIDALFSFGGATCEVLNAEAQKAALLHIAAGCNTAKFEDEDSYNFRLDVSESETARLTASYLKSRGVQTLAFLFVNNAWAEAIVRQTRQAVIEQGIKVLPDVSFPDSMAPDLRSQISRLKDTKPDVIFMLALSEILPAVLKQLREQAVSVPLMSNISLENPQALAFAGYLLDGVTYVGVKSAPQTPKLYPEFFEKFPGENPFIRWGYDSLILFSKSLEHSVPRQYLQQLKNFEGTFNIYSFDRHGELTLRYELRQVKDKKIYTLEELAS